MLRNGVVQCVAVCCCVMLCVWGEQEGCACRCVGILRNGVVQLLLRVAACCCVFGGGETDLHTGAWVCCEIVCCSMLQCVAACCSVLQYVAVQCCMISRVSSGTSRDGVDEERIEKRKRNVCITHPEIQKGILH